MKTHAKHVALGGILAPLILVIATAIANGAQQALNLNLHGTALAIFLVGFVGGATFVTNASVKAEAAKVLGEVGGLGGLLETFGGLFGGDPMGVPTAQPVLPPDPVQSIDPPAPPAPPAP